MRTAFRVAGLAVFLIVVTLWFFGGMHRGWTQVTVEIPQIDEVTELPYTVREKRFVPGVDFLAAGTAAAVGLFLLSFLARKKTVGI